MGQVPRYSSYLLIGAGRVARHFQHYFGLEGISFEKWERKDGQTALVELSRTNTHALILISDGAIENFLNENPFLLDLKVSHFSGALALEKIPSAHPLMTFSASGLYELEDYRRIPFVLESGRAKAEELLPGLKNPFYYIDSKNKGLYHALCSLSGNFTTLLWEKAFHEFQHELALPKDVLIPYLLQISKNLSNSAPGASVLTGPLVRGDQMTIEKHIKELGLDPYSEVYRAFVNAYQRESR